MYLSPEFVEFSLACIFHHVWEKFFNLWCSHFLENSLNLAMQYYWCPSPLFKAPGRIFWKSVSLKTNWWRKLWFSLSKFNWKIWRWLGTSAYLYFIWCNIFLNVMASQFCEWYLLNSVVLSLLPLLYNNSNLTLKLHLKKLDSKLEVYQEW